jgi:hypothetical protein
MGGTLSRKNIDKMLKIRYALGIYFLNLLIGFLTPRSMDVEQETEQNPEDLPSFSNDEYKPFIRKLPEFKFWYVL